MFVVFFVECKNDIEFRDSPRTTALSSGISP